MLTFPILVASWVAAAIGFSFLVYALYKRYWGPAIFAYLSVGFFLISLPFKLGLHATSATGMLFLAAVWPVWLGQHYLGYSMVGWFPPSFWGTMFNL